MTCLGLERFFDLPVIAAPKRNSKLYKEMWKNSTYCRAPLGVGYECATLHEAHRSSREMGRDRSGSYGSSRHTVRISTQIGSTCHLR